MPRHYQLISADSHLDLPPDRWTHRVPEKWRGRAPRRETLPNGGDGIVMENRPLYVVGYTTINSTPREQWRTQVASFDGGLGTGSPEQRLAEQDEDGVDAEVLFTHNGHIRLWRGMKEDEGLAALVHAYNEFLIEEYAATDPDRLLVMAVIPPTTVDDALAELRYCAGAGFRGVCLYRFPSGKGYPVPDDDRFWAAALDLAMPVVSHTGGGSTRFAPNEPGVIYPKVSDTERGDPITQLLRFGAETPFGAMQMALTGVFDRFPALRVYWAETQAGFLAHTHVQVDDNYHRYRSFFRDLYGLEFMARRPSDYFRENNLWGFLNDPYGVKTRHDTGVGALMWGSDFAHAASDWPNSRKLIDETFAGVPDEERERMTCGNAVDFFHLDAVPTAS